MLATVTAVLSRATTGDWLLFTGGILLLLYVIGTWNYDYFQRRGIPSSKPLVPFGGDTFMAFSGLRAFSYSVMDMYNKGKGHGIFGVFEFARPLLLIRDPELIKVIGVKDFDNFVNHRSFVSEKGDPLFGKTLFNLKDQVWRDMRATLSPAFTTSKIKVMLPLMSQCANQLNHYLREKYANSKEGKMKEPLPCDMKDIFTRMTNDIIATTAFGVSCDSLKYPENEFYMRGKKMTTFSKLRSLLFFAFLAFPKLMEKTGFRLLDYESSSFFDSLVHETIREREKRGIFRPDVLQLLMQAREGKLKAENDDETEDVGVKAKKLADEDISAQVVLFFFAGFETVSTAICFTTHELSHNPDIQRRLQAEVDEVMENTDGKPTYESIQGMKYLDAVVSEVLRLYPLAPMTDRICQNTTTIPAGASSKAATVSKGTIIQIPVIGLHLDPQYWDDPETFDPERFSDKNKHNIKPFTYLPFGVGPRICIAQRFALIEVKMVLVHLLRDFDLHPCAKTKHPVEYKTGGNIMVKGGFWCGLTPRERS